MPRPERGATAAGFRIQLLARLNNLAREQGISVQRLQQRVAFERLLARLSGSEDWLLKGGFALELRYGWRSRPTRDIDLRTEGNLLDTVQQLRASVASFDLPDHFTFELGETERELQGAPGGTLRVNVTARLASIVFSRFHVDLSSGDAVVGEPDEMTGSNLLSFAGIEPVRMPVYPVVQHLAEKLHAYTLPRQQENTRVKDLVDIVLFASTEAVQAHDLLAGVHATFTVRGTHLLPPAFPEPPATWGGPYRRLASQSFLAVPSDIAEACALASRFWDPVLRSDIRVARWAPEAQVWMNR